MRDRPFIQQHATMLRGALRFRDAEIAVSEALSGEALPP